jgi:hypothetical protein
LYNATPPAMQRRGDRACSKSIAGEFIFSLNPI